MRRIAIATACLSAATLVAVSLADAWGLLAGTVTLRVVELVQVGAGSMLVLSLLHLMQRDGW